MNTATLTPIPGTDATPNAIHDAFWRDGVVVVHDLYPAEMIAAAAARMDALLPELDDMPWGGGAAYAETMQTYTKAFFGRQDPEFAALFAFPAMRELTTAIVGPRHSENPIGAWATSTGCGQAWHQDSGSRDPSQYNLNRIVFCHDLLPGQGDLLVVPGSHRDRDLPPGELYEPIDGQVAVTPRANTTVFLHTRCFHCVTRNQTDRTRIQVNRRVCPADVSPMICSQARFRAGTWDFSTGKPWE